MSSILAALLDGNNIQAIVLWSDEFTAIKLTFNDEVSQCR